MRVQYVLRIIVKSQDLSRVPGSNLPTLAIALVKVSWTRSSAVRGMPMQRSLKRAQRWNEVDDGLFGIALRVGRWQI